MYILIFDFLHFEKSLIFLLRRFCVLFVLKAWFGIAFSNAPFPSIQNVIDFSNQDREYTNRFETGKDNRICQP
jgi:hypothetical protein